ncbi:MAG: zinc metalloprotease HtpX [Deltaproteobacteria bacterium]|nr:zinc metalloprotease HtpX [Deltaproteobacteria bacterium]
MYNRFKTAVLLSGLTALIVFFGALFGGEGGMYFAFILAMVMNFGSYWFSGRLVLRMYRAREIHESDDPELFSLVRGLAARANLPMPKLYVIPQETPNAFATGRNAAHAVIAVTQGLRRMMNRDELAGVLAHEMSHIKNRDILISTIAATLAGAIMILASMARWSAIFGMGGDDDDGANIVVVLVMAIIAPIAAMVIQMAISRNREYLADSSAAHLAGQSEGLARALTQLGQANKRLPMDANPSTAHMFIYNPLSGRRMARLFSTHPPLEERIARLRAMR